MGCWWKINKQKKKRDPISETKKKSTSFWKKKENKSTQYAYIGKSDHRELSHHISDINKCPSDFIRNEMSVRCHMVDAESL